jgi:hypothetical protein
MKTTRPLTLIAAMIAASCVLVAFAKPGKVNYARGDVRGHLMQLGQALMQYSTDYDDVLPPMQDAVAFQKLMAPYMHNMLMTDPHTGKPFTPNARLSGKRLSDVYREAFKTRQRAIVLYQALPGEGGARFVLSLPQPVMLNKDEPVWGYDGKNDPHELKITSVSYDEWPGFRTRMRLP